jgi:hypothetical protein
VFNTNVSVHTNLWINFILMCQRAHERVREREGERERESDGEREEKREGWREREGE